MQKNPIEAKEELVPVANWVDPDHFVVAQHTSPAGRAIIVYYWAAPSGRNPSDSQRMFWFARPTPSEGGARG